jgi:isopentenyl-diphosphate delta-isomerase
MSKVTPTSARKSDHLQIAIEEDLQSGLSTGLELLRFTHNAVPELDLNQIDISTTFFNKRLTLPLLISSMTGGTEAATKINQSLAKAAQTFGVAMGLGSQRAALEEPSLEPTFQIRQYAPDILLFANLGAVQLNYGYGIDECRRAVEMVEADALILHFNPLQEALQPEGNVNFSGLLSKIEVICSKLDVPVIAKEVGWGISPHAATQLIEAGISAIDVAGAGGTSWSQVEMRRTQDKVKSKLAANFINWGNPTAEVLIGVHEALPHIPLIASGGLQNGIDICKCIRLGANLGAIAGPFLKAAARSTDAVLKFLEQISAEIRICMFATGSSNLSSLCQAELRPIA